MTNPVNRNVAGLLAVLATTAAATASAIAQERLPTIPPAQYNDEQKQAAADFEAARKVPVFGPFEPLMHSPQVMSQGRAMDLRIPTFHID